MNSKQIKGLAVISVADGEKIGTVDHLYLDPTRWQIVGFSLKAGGLLHTGTGDLIDVSDVRSLGKDALTVADKSALRGQPPGDLGAALVEMGDLAKRKVVTEGGTFVGQVVSAEFDDATFALREIEASPGFFKTNRLIPREQIISIGADVMVVADAVLAADGEQPSESRYVSGDVQAAE